MLVHTGCFPKAPALENLLEAGMCEEAPLTFLIPATSTLLVKASARPRGRELSGKRDLPVRSPVHPVTPHSAQHPACCVYDGQRPNKVPRPRGLHSPEPPRRGAHGSQGGLLSLQLSTTQDGDPQGPGNVRPVSNPVQRPAGDWLGPPYLCPQSSTQGRAAPLERVLA